MPTSSATNIDNPAVRGGSFRKALRRVIPSVAGLTFNPLFKAAVAVPDAALRFVFPGFRGLPPAHLRARVGVGDEILRNHLQFHYTSHFWMLAFQKGWANLSSNIVDVGCGVGRYAHHLRDFNMMGQRYTGTYTGIDIDREALEWCRKHFDNRFEWRHSNDASTTYANVVSDKDAVAYAMPVQKDTQDFVFSTSLFTHLLEPELRNYLSESKRVLKAGGVICHTVFCLDYPPPTYGTRHTFSHLIGKAHCESLASPEAAVAYTAADLIAMATEAGFTSVEILHGPGVIQPALVAKA